MPKGKWTKVVQALETGDISSGKLNGIKFSGKEVKIGETLSTPIAYYQGEDGSLVADSEWIVCGFNGAVPEYVKYVMNGCVRVFVKSAGDDGVERKIDQGMDVFTREWDAAALDYKYTRIGMTIGVEGEFKYGDTSTDYGTISIKDPYAVPTKLDVRLDSNDKVLEATFAGYNMQLWSKHTYLDCDDADTLERAKQIFSGRVLDELHYPNDEFIPYLDAPYTMMSYECEKEDGYYISWKRSNIRRFLNGTMKPTIYYYKWDRDPDVVSGADRSFTAKHTFLEKVSLNNESFLENICSQINRTWRPGTVIENSMNAGKKNTVFMDRSSDRFWLPSIEWFVKDCGDSAYNCELLGSNEERYSDMYYGFCAMSLFDDTSKEKYIMKNFINGAKRSQLLRSFGWRSAINSSSICLIQIQRWSGMIAEIDRTDDLIVTSAIAPACTIG